jgi:ribosomal-protein-alanine N-acetyltransferase
MNRTVRLGNNVTQEVPLRLETAHLVLRALALRDADDIFAYAADPEVAQYTLWSAHTMVEESRRFIAWVMRGSLMCWALIHPEHDRVIGTCFLHSFHPQHQRAEIAFNLARSYWGQGYATEAVRVVLGVGFTSYSLNRIEGTCMLDNVASARVMEKVGMRYEGILRQYVYAKHAFHDMKLYAILREDRWALG